jgi:hypothetical protein
MSMNSYDSLIVSSSNRTARSAKGLNIHHRGEYRIRTDDPLLAKQVL